MENFFDSSTWNSDSTEMRNSHGGHFASSFDQRSNTHTTETSQSAPNQSDGNSHIGTLPNPESLETLARSSYQNLDAHNNFDNFDFSDYVFDDAVETLNSSEASHEEVKDLNVPVELRSSTSPIAEADGNVFQERSTAELPGITTESLSMTAKRPSASPEGIAALVAEASSTEIESATKTNATFNPPAELLAQTVLGANAPVGSANLTGTDNSCSEFWEQNCRLFHPTSNSWCAGTYAELLNEFPELSGTISEQFNRWQQTRKGVPQHVPDRLAQQPQTYGPNRLQDTQDLADRSYRVGDGTSTQPVQYVEAPDIGASQRSAAVGPQSSVPYQLQPLVAVPAQRKDSKFVHFTCCRRLCRRDSPMNGLNDALHCTRCYNKINSERRYQLSEAKRLAALQGQPLQWPTATPTPITDGLVTGPQQMTGRNRAYIGESVPGVSSNIRGEASTPTSSAYSNFAAGAPGNNNLPSGFYSPHPADDEDEDEDEDDTDDEDDESTESDLEHKTVDDARQYLLRPSASVCKRPKIKGDDWQAVKENSKSLCEQLYRALREPVADAPVYFAAVEREYFVRNQKKAHLAVRRLMSTPQKRTEVKARVIVAIDEIIAVHEIGIPGLSDTDEHKTIHGYEPEMKLQCGDRARMVITAVRNNKYVAQDILRSSNLQSLARAPEKYLERKYDNAQTNAWRSEELKRSRKLKEGKQSIEEIVKEAKEAPKKKRGRKPKAEAVQTTTMPTPEVGFTRGTMNTHSTLDYSMSASNTAMPSGLADNQPRAYQPPYGLSFEAASANTQGQLGATTVRKRTRSATEGDMNEHGAGTKRTKLYQAGMTDEDEGLDFAYGFNE